MAEKWKFCIAKQFLALEMEFFGTFLFKKQQKQQK